MRAAMPARFSGLIVVMLLRMSSASAAQVDSYSVLSSLIGHSKAELIQRFGQPSDTITTIGGELLIYETLDAGRIGGISGRDSRAGGADDFRSLSRSYAFRCKTEVVIAEGRVRAFNRSGNDCR
jgi:hypothetical protein